MRFFRDSAIDSDRSFDEGPEVRVKAATAVNSASIETAPIDPYRQGVSLTQQKHFDAGIIKIHAGEPGHQLTPNRYGMDNAFRAATHFTDSTYYDTATFISAAVGNPGFINIDLPSYTPDDDANALNGTVEPFTIRDKVSFMGIESPYFAHDVRGAMMCGNVDPQFGCEMIKTVDDWREKSEAGAYLDLIEMFGTFSTIEFFIYKFDAVTPFDDNRRPRGVPLSPTQDSGFITAMSPMTGSTENYVRPDQRSATSGFTYANNRFPGTDSLAFGGQTH